jgi:spermidine/putrescine transport system permease protein
MDLGANEWTTFWKVTFPLILPGVVAAALLAFSLSIDDFVVTSFTSGATQTFPLYIYGAQLRGIPVQVNVIGTIIFVSAVLLVILTTVWQRRVAARDFAPVREAA